MEHMEKLMQEALQGRKSSFKELYSYAGSGNAEAQYYLALYYKEREGGGADSNYAYWMQKAKEKGFAPEQQTVIPEPAVVEEQEVNSNGKSDNPSKILLMKFSFSGRINRTEYILSYIASIVLFFLSLLVEDRVLGSIIQIFALWFWFSQGARRLHDLGASGWWILIHVSLFYIMFPKGDERENEYGPCPK